MTAVGGVPRRPQSSVMTDAVFLHPVGDRLDLLLVEVERLDGA